MLNKLILAGSALGIALAPAAAQARDHHNYNHHNYNHRSYNYGYHYNNNGGAIVGGIIGGIIGGAITNSYGYSYPSYGYAYPGYGYPSYGYPAYGYPSYGYGYPSTVIFSYPGYNYYGGYYVDINGRRFTRDYMYRRYGHGHGDRRGHHRW